MHQSDSERFDAEPETEGRLRVVFISTQQGWHGGERQAFVLAKGLRARGHDCRFLVRGGSDFETHAVAEGFPTESFPGRGRGPWGMWRIRRALSQLKPDVIHMNDAHALTSGGLASMGLPGAIRVVSRRVDFPVRLATRYRRWCDCVLCVSHSVVRTCRKAGIPDSRLRLVYDGLDLSSVEEADGARGRATLDLKEDRLLLVSVATLTDCKGHRYLLDAMKIVVDKVPGAVLALAGDGELSRPLRRQVKELGLEDHVHFLGYRQDAPDLIKGSDVFVLASHTEGLCTAVIEAMLAERPIVTTTAGGLQDLVAADGPDDEPVGWMTKPRDAIALAQTILHVLGSPDAWEEMGRRARRRALERFTADRMVDETIAAYRELIEAKHSRNAAASPETPVRKAG